jgi:hypothetical protein
MAGFLTAQIAQLRQRIVNILNSDPVQKINFSFRKVRVSGSDYSYVALAMVGKHSSVKYDFAVAAGAEATYDPATNTFSFPHPGYGASSAIERVAIVHECTHAVIDAKRSSLGQIPELDNEIAAYIASGLFNVFDGAKFAPTGAGVNAAAHTLATRMAKNISTWNYTGAYSVDNSDVAPLSAAIVGHPVYKGISATKSYGEDGLRL